MLFLHGYLSDGNSFALQKQYLSSCFKVFTPDLKGFGKNTGMPYPYSLKDYADEVMEYIKANGLVKPHVIAHSFGGRVALKVIERHPNAFDKLVLTDSAGLKPKRTFKKVIKRCVFKVLRLFIKREKLISFYSKDYQALSPVMRQSFNLIVNEHLDHILKRVNNNTLIINGSLDKDTPIYMAKRFNKGIKNSKLIILEGAGHFSFIDKPLKYNMEVKEFLLS